MFWSKKHDQLVQSTVQDVVQSAVQGAVAAIAEQVGQAQQALPDQSGAVLEQLNKLGRLQYKNGHESLEWRRRLEQLQRLQVEMKRLAADFSLFPFVGWQALLWHRVAQVGEAGFAEIADETSDPESQELLDEMAEQHEEIVRGILHLKKKYPLVYRQYQEQWEALFDEHTAGVNREARRRLR